MKLIIVIDFRNCPLVVVSALNNLDALVIASTTLDPINCQIASNRDPLFASKADPSDVSGVMLFC